MKSKRFKAIAAITIAFYVAGIITAIHAVMTVRTPQGAIAWSVSLVSFPFVAVPAYLVFGRSTFEGMVQAYDARRSEIEALEAQVRQTRGSPRPKRARRFTTPCAHSPAWRSRAATTSSC